MQVLWLLIRSILMLSLDTEKKLSYYPIRVLKVSNHLTKQRTSILNEDRPKLRTPNFNLDTLIVLSTNTIFFLFLSCHITYFFFSYLIVYDQGGSTNFFPNLFSLNCINATNIPAQQHVQLRCHFLCFNVRERVTGTTHFTR